MTTGTLIKDRPYAGESDLPAICDLLNLCDALEKLDDNYDLEALRLEFEHPDVDQTNDLHLWEDESGRLIGFGQTWIRTIEDATNGKVLEGHLYFRVHPEAREGDLAGRMIRWGEERMRSLGQERALPVRIDGWGRQHETFTLSALERNGFAVVRYFFKMARPLNQPIPEPQLPAGYILRHVASDSDIAAWVAAFNNSFIDHWNHHPETIESHAHWLKNPNYKPERDLIAVAPDGTLAAFCFCTINSAENERNGKSEGWIEKLGTVRGYRQQGLGTALLLAGMRRLKEDGVETACLGVDTNNPSGALRLYEAVGFQPTLTTVVYRKSL